MVVKKIAAACRSGARALIGGGERGDYLCFAVVVGSPKECREQCRTRWLYVWPSTPHRRSATLCFVCITRNDECVFSVCKR